MDTNLAENVPHLLRLPTMLMRAYRSEDRGDLVFGRLRAVDGKLTVYAAIGFDDRTYGDIDDECWIWRFIRHQDDWCRIGVCLIEEPYTVDVARIALNEITNDVQALLLCRYWQYGVRGK